MSNGTSPTDQNGPINSERGAKPNLIIDGTLRSPDILSELSNSNDQQFKQAPKSATRLTRGQTLTIYGMKLGICDLDLTLLKTGEYHDGPSGRFAYALKAALRDHGISVLGETWNKLWEGDNNFPGFRSATGQSEDDVFATLIKMAHETFNIVISTNKLRYYNNQFIHDHFEQKEHLIEVMSGADQLVKRAKDTSSKLALCTSSGGVFVDKVRLSAEKDPESRFAILKEFDFVKHNANKRCGRTFYAEPVEEVLTHFRAHGIGSEHSCMFGDGIADFGSASLAGVPLVILAVDPDGSEGEKRADAIVAQVEAAIRDFPSDVSRTGLVLVDSFHQVQFAAAAEDQKAVRWVIKKHPEGDTPTKD